MEARLKEINPNLHVETINDFITETNIDEFLNNKNGDSDISRPRFDCVIDCVDNEFHKVGVSATKLAYLLLFIYLLSHPFYVYVPTINMHTNLT